MTSRDLWVRVKPLIESALTIPPEDRPAYLGDVCAGDEALHNETLRVLDACEVAGSSLGFLESPAVELAAPLLEIEAESRMASGQLVPGVAIGPYVLERHLGAGGMGVVYLARDPRLDRRVALKLLPAWLPVDDEGNRRLTEEAKAASRLDHPNIQTVYEIGKTPDGSPFIAMAYYDGETLKDRIGRGPLDVGFAVDVACQIADGLGAAHSHGIVHRDIKPGNLIVTPQGLVKILDFGAAKVTGHGLGHGARAVGTVSYMSPEQTRGEDVDPHTDIWSLGVVIYEMLTGRRPFIGSGPEAVIDAIREAGCEPLIDLRPDVPEDLAEIVRRCFEEEPRRRFGDGAALAGALRRIGHGGDVPATRPPVGYTRRAGWAAALAGAVLLAALVLWPGQGTITPTSGVQAPFDVAPTRLAVLPVRFPSGRQDEDYLGDALTEELISGFSRLEGLRVTALGSVMPYKGTTLAVGQIARDLGAQALVTSSLEASGDDVRLSVRLVDAESGSERWEGEYVTSLVGLQSIVGVVVEESAAALNVADAPGGPGAAAGTESAEALDLYYRGRHFLAKLATPGATQEARSYFEQALDLDPTFAAAWSGLSGAYHQLAIQVTLPAGDAEPRAREAAERALEIDPDLAEAHTHLAAVLSWYYWDADEAERHFRRAIELDPSSARAHQFFAVHLRNHGRFDEALEMVRVSAELDPLSPGALEQEGEILYTSRRYEESLAKFRQLLTVEPTYAWSYFFIALANIQLGRYDEGLDALDRADRHFIRDGIRGYALGLQGRRDEAYRALARLDSLPATGLIRFNKATLYVGLGELDTAIDQLEEALEDRPLQLQLVGTVPEFDPLRSDPRFQALLRELGLTD